MPKSPAQKPRAEAPSKGAFAPRRRGRPPRTDAPEAILLAAQELFRERGYANVAVEDIVQAAKVSRPTLYRIFDGKAGIADALLRRFVSQTQQAVFEAANGEESLEELWKAGVSAYMGALLAQDSLLPDLVQFQNLSPETIAFQDEAVLAYTSALNALMVSKGGNAVPPDYLEAFLAGIDRLVLRLAARRRKGETLPEPTAYVEETWQYLKSLARRVSDES